MTPEQADKALKLLQALHADIEALRHKGHWFGPFMQTNHGITTSIEWPNLAILHNEIKAILKEHNHVR